MDAHPPTSAATNRFANTGAHRHRPRGYVRHYAGLVTPGAGAALPALLERNRLQRLERLLRASASGIGHPQAARRRMRALVAKPGARMRWRSVPAPAAPGPEQAIVHPLAASTCDVDCPLALGTMNLALPVHLGHECVAEVLAVGERVSAVKPGDRVVVPFQISCGSCLRCVDGYPGSCLSVPPLSAFGMGVGGGHFGGAFSDELMVPYADAMLVPLPDGIAPATAASLSDNIADAYRHIAPHLPALLATDTDAQILIIAGLSRRPRLSPSVALYAGQIALALGARNVHLVDSRAEVRAHAERLGLVALKPRELRGQAPAPLVVHSSADPLRLALTHTAPDGVCTSNGGLHRRTAIPLMQMYIRRCTLHVGIPHARTNIPGALELIAQGKLRPEQVTTSIAPFDDAPHALREHCLAGATKTVLVRGA
jgi:alcohol dehydrogenase